MARFALLTLALILPLSACGIDGAPRVPNTSTPVEEPKLGISGSLRMGVTHRI